MNQKGEQKMGTESIPKLMVSMSCTLLFSALLYLL